MARGGTNGTMSLKQPSFMYFVAEDTPDFPPFLIT
jgi:hypothetical protein